MCAFVSSGLRPTSKETHPSPTSHLSPTRTRVFRGWCPQRSESVMNSSRIQQVVPPATVHAQLRSRPNQVTPTRGSRGDCALAQFSMRPGGRPEKHRVQLVPRGCRTAQVCMLGGRGLRPAVWAASRSTPPGVEGVVWGAAQSPLFGREEVKCARPSFRPAIWAASCWAGAWPPWTAPGGEGVAAGRRAASC